MTLNKQTQNELGNNCFQNKRGEFIFISLSIHKFLIDCKYYMLQSRISQHIDDGDDDYDDDDV